MVLPFSRACSAAAAALGYATYSGNEGEDFAVKLKLVFYMLFGTNCVHRYQTLSICFGCEKESEREIENTTNTVFVHWIVFGQRYMKSNKSLSRFDAAAATVCVYICTVCKYVQDNNIGSIYWFANSVYPFCKWKISYFLDSKTL